MNPVNLQNTEKEYPMQGKTCLVTGGSSGIGKATALGLARMGAEVIIVCHSPRRGQLAVQELRTQSGSPRIHLHLADLSLQAEVRRLAAEVQNQFPHLHGLINVAGSLFRQRQITVDGLEMNLALNYLAYFLLTNLLLEHLTASAPARVVNVTSFAHWWGKLDFTDLQSEHKYNLFRAYGRAKLAIILFTRQLAQRLDGCGVSANCVHPGIVATRIIERVVDTPLAHRVAEAIFLTPEEGAEAVVHLAAAPETARVNGEYFVRFKIARGSRATRNMQDARRLWDVSEKLTHHSSVP